ncbi:MAG: [FeFe] hydrogenase H-cluster maturation GTPase HydF [Treponema sp.]|nr:[FeFe] hydrogenase H-cluster maturation GTPase HydF [Treponema sp.]
MIQRTTIAFFGRTNAGKSFLVNSLAAQNVSIVSAVKGTTTDPVKKTMELLPLGPVTLIDTPGLDDQSELGEERMKKTQEVLESAQIAVLVCDASIKEPFGEYEKKLAEQFTKKNIPYVVAMNKCDMAKESPEVLKYMLNTKAIPLSAKTGANIHALKEKIAALWRCIKPRPLMSDLVRPGSTVVLVIPIDSGAPKDRIILPQQMVIRDLLECDAMPLCCTPNTLRELCAQWSKLQEVSVPVPALVITDSQVFHKVNKMIPQEIPLTSFSILMARYKGTLFESVAGIKKLDALKDGDKILVSEGCTHHRQCEDIGTVKIPALIKQYSGKNVQFDFTSGNTFPHDLKSHALVIHCGGCMLNEKEMENRILRCTEQCVPATNYGLVLAHINGILARSLAPLKMDC